MGRRSWVGAGLGAALVGAVGVGLLVAPAGASAAPPLPPVSPEDLVSSVMTAQRGPFAGEVEVDNALGLPAVPGVPQLADGTSTVRVWSGGEDRGRVAIPSPDGERTLVSDGTTRWAYDSRDRTATRAPAGDHGGPPEGQQQDPTAAATQAIATLRQTSTVAVDGTAEVAGRAVYQLVLTPQPTERTLLREVRVAVDAETRQPLQLTVLAQGQGEPALRVGFSEITYGPQDPSLFTFTPPPGTTVRDAPARDGEQRPEGDRPRSTVGDGWDTVVIGQAPQPGDGRPRDGQDGQDQRPEGAPDLSALGQPVSGPWGSGRVITTAVATVIVTDDGRIAAGAVPQQVLTEALAR
ncbi:LolA family protein [Actinomycetospora straminea]|uniref:Sigma-E factor regulatory protein RseB domain-containing protein n=1 Tax=Actinomycetospora straminea TaxID=663607 RepID=A0ABP9E9K3_9PSEU|nr:outer membrane lipoprotein carrier protein LolA [Actinomycetospora straminea]MDD7935356.1 outer membrane lipoprotein carrier protein LolA [Actinomycetospora straminea]